MGALPEDLQGFKAAVLWAFPASTSAPHIWALLVKAGMVKVAVDVRLSDTARKSDIAIIVKPGTDVFLALGVVKVIIEEGLVEGRVRHLEDLANYVKQYTLSYLSDVSGVKVDEIKWLAEFYHDHKPVTLIGFALGRSLNGGDAIGLISLIFKPNKAHGEVLNIHWSRVCELRCNWDWVIHPHVGFVGEG